MQEQYPSTYKSSLDAGTGVDLSKVDKAALVSGSTERSSSKNIVRPFSSKDIRHKCCPGIDLFAIDDTVTSSGVSGDLFTSKDHQRQHKYHVNNVMMSRPNYSYSATNGDVSEPNSLQQNIWQSNDNDARSQFGHVPIFNTPICDFCKEVEG